MRSCGITLLLGGIFLVALYACGRDSAASGEPPVSGAASVEFALYALSRGKGVPEPTYDALQKSRTLLEDAKQRGDVLELRETRIGLEGETRLCVAAKDAAAARELQLKVRALSVDVELFNIVEESCSKQ
jgi:hypothetical protein